MRKKSNDYLQVEAIKLGLQKMLIEVKGHLEKGQHTESFKAVLTDQKNQIEQRLEALK